MPNSRNTIRAKSYLFLIATTTITRTQPKSKLSTYEKFSKLWNHTSPVQRKKRKSYKTNSYARVYLFIYFIQKNAKVLTKNKFNEPPNPFGCVLVLLSYHKFRNSTIPFTPFELRTFFYFSQEKKCEEKLKFIDNWVKVEKNQKVWSKFEKINSCAERRRKESKPTKVKWRRRNKKKEGGRRPVLTEIECESAPRA